ncbi:hypothetical protein [Chloroherpeton thalassium]|uniref:hypothetical protein n=1 Tax=Chloroherpeton thalassium TaxID=100716 RepID=UPI000319A7D6|nr:hypothetical protein [Chloroherpeton thalassium]
MEKGRVTWKKIRVMLSRLRRSIHVSGKDGFFAGKLGMTSVAETKYDHDETGLKKI